MKATNIIKRDHEAAKDLFEQYKKAAKDERESLAEKIFEALDTHEKMEDNYFYPALKDKMEDDAMLAELEAEQEALTEELEEVRDMSGDKDARLKDLMEKVLAHAKKEEQEIFPKAEELLSAKELEELGSEMEPESAVANAEED